MACCLKCRTWVLLSFLQLLPLCPFNSPLKVKTETQALLGGQLPHFSLTQRKKLLNSFNLDTQFAAPITSVSPPWTGSISCHSIVYLLLELLYHYTSDVAGDFQCSYLSLQRSLCQSKYIVEFLTE